MADRLGPLIDHVVATFHRTHAVRFDAMYSAIRHARTVALRDRIAAAVHALDDELRHHIDKEQSMLFPWLRRNPRSGSGPIRVMHLEHTDVLARLEHVEVAVADAIAASPTGDPALREAAAELARFVVEHVTFETTELFPCALGV